MLSIPVPSMVHLARYLKFELRITTAQRADVVQRAKVFVGAGRAVKHILLLLLDLGEQGLCCGYRVRSVFEDRKRVIGEEAEA